MGGDAKVSEQTTATIKELDQLLALVKQQSATLDASLGQIDRYQQVRPTNQGKEQGFLFLSKQEIQQLRQQIINVEQQLRVVCAPTYLPHNREKALEEQNVSRKLCSSLGKKYITFLFILVQKLFEIE